MTPHEINVISLFINLVVALVVSASPLFLAFYLEAKNYYYAAYTVMGLYVLLGLLALADMVAK